MKRSDFTFHFFVKFFNDSSIHIFLFLTDRFLLGFLMRLLIVSASSGLLVQSRIVYAQNRPCALTFKIERISQKIRCVSKNGLA